VIIGGFYEFSTLKTSLVCNFRSAFILKPGRTICTSGITTVRVLTS